MTFTLIANIATILLCAAVTVQSVRMMRSLNAVKRGDLAQVVSALDQATMQARIVMSEMKGTLKRCSDSSDALMRAEAIAEELRMMTELADASAERLSQVRDSAPAKPLVKPKGAAKPRRDTGDAGTKEAAAKTAATEKEAA
ncbi:DUF6468 domain-containing protein [Stakelama pacifica]|uniref:DUF6468 domain-containing protein n=1 Tax=Stakelama pacifica TaxID=517720 RepID=A0A4R6FKQ6_9SPHN|nr:DUF6468 domain-containing protein [Stakelama pacifica]TDN81165.1 hypothetical protein EV664_108107 [Stakelama pacifica]GGO96945.1 hypothetical protein GCM10011329_24640 [Stakelama pacifica]